MALEYAILGFLEQGPRTGYDLKKDFDHSIRHFWSATQSHVYKALDGLTAKQWLSFRVVLQEGKPNRKEYQLTELGRDELRRWLATPQPLEPVREAWLVQLFFSNLLTQKEIELLLLERLAAVQVRIAGYRQIHESIKDQPPEPLSATSVWRLTLDYGLEYYRWEAVWLQNSLALFEKTN